MTTPPWTTNLSSAQTLAQKGNFNQCLALCQELLDEHPGDPDLSLNVGLPVMDAVLLDKWHAPAGMQDWFVEPVIRLDGGRLCYTPVPFAPAVSPVPPCIQRGSVTFGSFNNNSKINDRVLDAWAKILEKTPGSRLILKWRTFHDEPFCKKMHQAFYDRGITPDRIELRGFSFHKDMLLEYADIDIALDPFPFSGGLTTCEALWMGVPVVSYPSSRVVSRQGLAVLSAIGLPDLAAETPETYVETAVALAQDIQRLQQLRAGMRSRMKDSMLMDVKGFTGCLEQSLRDLYGNLYRSVPSA